MSSDGGEPATLVLIGEHDADGTRWRAVELTVGGELVVVGQGLGPGVARFFGCEEYEFRRTLTAADVARLRILLKVSDDDDLLGAIGRSFVDTLSLEEFLVENGIPGSLWNRIGD
jgi:hypothetical protein